jgi:hypothetical protein
MGMSDRINDGTEKQRNIHDRVGRKRKRFDAEGQESIFHRFHRVYLFEDIPVKESSDLIVLRDQKTPDTLPAGQRSLPRRNNIIVIFKKQILQIFFNF